MLVLSGVFNTIIFQKHFNKEFGCYELREPRLYDCQLHTYGCLQPIKKRLMFLPGYGPMAIADWSIIVQCHLLVKHGF
jgi:hypothetical protein